MRFVILVFLLVLVTATSSVSAQTQFIKYKKYFIPISLAPDVYYIDDVDDSRQDNIGVDPNGVQELPILVGWKNLGHYNLVGVGAAGHGATFHPPFVKGVLALMDVDIDVFAGTDLIDDIIDKALEHGSPNKRLVIVIGGPRDIVDNAITEANERETPINDLIRVIGIQTCDESNPTNCPVNVDTSTIAALGADNHHIVPCYSDTTPSCRAFYSNSSVFNYIDHNSWYQTHYYQSAIGQYIKHNKGGTDYTLEDKVKSENSGISMKIADFTALAYLIWGDEIWSDEFKTRMYEELETGLATLP